MIHRHPFLKTSTLPAPRSTLLARQGKVNPIFVRLSKQTWTQLPPREDATAESCHVVTPSSKRQVWQHKFAWRIIFYQTKNTTGPSVAFSGNHNYKNHKNNRLTRHIRCIFCLISPRRPRRNLEHRRRWWLPGTRVSMHVHWATKWAHGSDGCFIIPQMVNSLWKWPYFVTQPIDIA